MMGLHRMLGRAVLAALCVGAAPQLAHAQASPLVVVGQDSGQNAGGFTEVKKRKSSDDDGDSGGSRKWFSFWFPDELKPELEDKKWPLVIVGFIFGLEGGSLWAPLLLGGASFDMEWALPSLIYWIIGAVAWVLGWVGIIGYGYGWLITFPIGVIVSSLFFWIAIQTAIANLNRPEIELKSSGDSDSDSGSSKKRKKKARRSDDDDDE